MNKKLEINFTKKPEMVFNFDQFLNVEKAVDTFLNKKENLNRLIAPLIPTNLEETIQKLIPEVEDGKTPIKGVDYDDGKDGETPDEETLVSLIKTQIPEPIPGKDGTTPKKGIDYFTKKELETIKKGLKEAIMSEMTNHATKEEVNIKIEEIKKQINKLPQTGGAQFLRQLMDVNVGVPTAQQYGLTYNPQRSEFSLTAITGGGAVDSVNGQTGVVVLDTGDIAEATDANYVSDAQLSIITNTTASFTTIDETKLDNITVTQAVNLDTMEADIAALANGMVYKGNWDASAGTFPGAGSAETGWFYTVSVGGTVDSVVFNIGDRLIATTDNASTTIFAGNWSQLDATDAVTSVFSRTGNVVSANGDYTASQITNVPAGNIAAVTVQTALNELDNEKQPLDTQLTSLAGLSYASNALKVVRVNAGETDFELATISSSGATTALDNLASVAINTSLISDTDNTDNLGSTLIKWANLFVTTIGATATRVTKGWFTDIESTNIPTVGGTPVLSSLTAPQFTTVELGHATDTTLSRVSAGVVAVEGKTLANLTDGGTFAADISVPDEAYGVGWNGSVEVPTKNAVYDKIETLSAFSPTTTQTFFDDFMFGNETTGSIGEQGWSFQNVAGTSSIQVLAAGSRTGNFRITTGGTDNNGGVISAGGGLLGGTNQYPMAVGNRTIIFSIKPTNTSDICIRCGLASDGQSDPISTGIYFELDTDVNANWRGACNGASTTYTSSTTAPTTSYKQFKIVMDATAANIEFFIDSVSLGSISTNITGNNGELFFQVLTRTGSAKSGDIDYMYMTTTGLSR